MCLVFCIDLQAACMKVTKCVIHVHVGPMYGLACIQACEEVRRQMTAIFVGPIGRDVSMKYLK